MLKPRWNAPNWKSKIVENELLNNKKLIFKILIFAIHKEKLINFDRFYLSEFSSSEIMKLDNQIKNYIMDVHSLWLLEEISDFSKKLRETRQHIAYLRSSLMIFSFHTLQHLFFQFPTLHIIFSLSYSTLIQILSSPMVFFSFNNLPHHILSLILI